MATTSMEITIPSGGTKKKDKVIPTTSFREIFDQIDLTILDDTIIKLNINGTWYNMPGKITLQDINFFIQNEEIKVNIEYTPLIIKKLIEELLDATTRFDKNLFINLRKKINDIINDEDFNTNIFYKVNITT